MLTEYEKKQLELGHWAKVLVDLHIEKPEKFSDKFYC